MSTYRRVTYEDRCQIYALSKGGTSQESIASVRSPEPGHPGPCRPWPTRMPMMPMPHKPRIPDQRPVGAVGYRHTAAGQADRQPSSRARIAGCGTRPVPETAHTELAAQVRARPATARNCGRLGLYRARPAHSPSTCPKLHC
jgi:hypothetical protein